MPNEAVSITLTMVKEDLDTERALNVLQAELEAVSHLHIRRITSYGKASQGTKAIFQDIALLVSASVPALSVFATIVRAWIKSQEKRSIKLAIGRDSIELSGPWSDAQTETLNHFLSQHTPPQRADSIASHSKTRRRGGRT
jgi:hypothetical protein